MEIKSYSVALKKLPKQKTYIDFASKYVEYEIIWDKSDLANKYSDKEHHIYEQMLEEQEYLNEVLIKLNKISLPRREYDVIRFSEGKIDMKETLGHMAYVKKFEERLEYYKQFSMPDTVEKLYNSTLIRVKNLYCLYEYTLNDQVRDVIKFPKDMDKDMDNQVECAINRCQMKEAYLIEQKRLSRMTDHEVREEQRLKRYYDEAEARAKSTKTEFERFFELIEDPGVKKPNIFASLAAKRQKKFAELK